MDALSDAATAKINKYAPLKEFLLSKGKSCEIYPFVIGAFGSWYKQNEILLTKLAMTCRYKLLFRKLCCTDATKGSNSIYTASRNYMQMCFFKIILATLS